MTTDVHDDVDYDLEVFVVGPYTFEVTTIAYMPIEVLMMMGEKKVEISGQKLWCGSLAVIEYLLDHSQYAKDMNVLELGAGTGVLGMLCSRLGAKHVILTDNDQRSLDHMVSDCKRNDVVANVVKLDWFNPPNNIDMNDLVQKQEDNKDTNDADSTKNNTCKEEIFRIVAGDVLYKRELLEPFMNTTKVLLQYFHNSKMLLCHVPRAGIDQKDIIDLATASGLHVDIIDPVEWRKGSVVEYSPPEDYNRACLYQLTAAI